MKLSQAGNGEGRVGFGLGLEQHLPEAGGEVDRGKNGTSRSANFSNAFTDIFHQIFVSVCLRIQGPEVLNQSKTSVLFGDDEDGAVELASGRLHNTQF